VVVGWTDPEGSRSHIVGFSAMTNVATATQLYLRYDGELASGTDNHALTGGLRLSW